MHLWAVGVSAKPVKLTLIPNAAFTSKPIKKGSSNLFQIDCRVSGAQMRTIALYYNKNIHV
jgi:hypothetical protein